MQSRHFKIRKAIQVFLVIFCILGPLLLVGAWFLRQYIAAFACSEQMHAISGAITMYRNAHAGEYPKALRDLVDEVEMDPRMYFCSLDGSEYGYTGNHARTDDKEIEKQILVFETNSRHRLCPFSTPKRYVLFYSGQVDLITDKQFHTIMQRDHFLGQVSLGEPNASH